MFGNGLQVLGTYIFFSLHFKILLKVSQVFFSYLFVGQRRWYHAGVSLYGKEHCYTKEGILTLTHVL